MADRVLGVSVSHDGDIYRVVVTYARQGSTLTRYIYGHRVIAVYTPTVERVEDVVYLGESPTAARYIAEAYRKAA